jgi:riboflavin kinase / FMN adenylyltransferase
MQIFAGTEAFKKTPRPIILTLGNFDGLHLGHQKILRHVVREAKRSGLTSSVFTFKDHPQQILHPQLPPPELMISPEHKLFLFQQLGIEACFFVPFTVEFSKTEPEGFVQEVLLKQIGMKKMCLGYNARFGHDRKGSPALMKELSKKLGFEFEEIGPVQVAGEPVSSSRIRKLLAAGELNEAAACLGRSYSILGKVVKGDSRGKELGFPTANIELPSDLLLPRGVYPVFVREVSIEFKNAQEYKASIVGDIKEGVLNYGVKPTFGAKNKPGLEIFLFGHTGDLYGSTLEVFFGPSLRPEKRFESPEALQAQMERDVSASKAYFASTGGQNKAQISAFTKEII